MDRLSETFDSWLRSVARLPTAQFVEIATPLRNGDTLCQGRFQIEKTLGQGSMGVVYQAYDRQWNAFVALKTLPNNQSDRLFRFKQEFRGLQDIHHPNLVTLGDLFEENGRWFFTMELVRGNNFIEYIRKDVKGTNPSIGKPFDEVRLRSILFQLAQGLRALHRAEKVHRDVKPSNTLVTEEERLVLLDFGLLAEIKQVKSKSQIVGTVAYMAPEQTIGESVGPAADWYSLGVMLYESLTGRLPFRGDRQTILKEKIQKDPPPPEEIVPNLPNDLSQLCIELLYQLPEQRPSGKEVLLRLAPKETKPSQRIGVFGKTEKLFVGREKELQQLHNAFYQTQTGQAVTVHIQGEAGIGKSTLLQKFSELLCQETKALVLFARCYEREFVPYKALDSLIDSLAIYLEKQESKEVSQYFPKNFSELARMFPVLGKYSSFQAQAMYQEEPSPEPFELRRRAFLALREIMARLLEKHPVVLVIEDLQWIDSDSMAGLRELLSPPESPPLLLLLSSQTKTGTKELLLPVHVQNISLQALHEEETKQLAIALSQQRGFSQLPNLQKIIKESQGHPFFVEELIQYASHGNFTPSRLELDDALWDWLHDELSENSYQVAELVSLMGQPISDELLTHTVKIAPENLQRVRKELQVKHIIRSSESSQNAQIEPYHKRIQQTILSRINLQRKQEVHKNLASTLETISPEKFELLAHHWHAAGFLEKAQYYAEKAAQNAYQTLAFSQAINLYQEAINLTPSREKLAELYRALGNSFANAGQGKQAAEAYQKAIPYASSEEAHALERLAAEQLLRAGCIDEGLQVLDNVLSRLQIKRPKTLLKTLWAFGKEQTLLQLAQLHSFPKSVSHPPEELSTKLDTYWAAAIGLSQVAPIAGSIFHSRFLRLALENNDKKRMALGFCMQAIQKSSTGPPAKRSYQILSKVKTLAKELDDPQVEAYLALTQSGVAFLTGFWSRSLMYGTQAVSLFREYCTGAFWELATAQRFVLTCLWHTGQLLDLQEKTPIVLHEMKERGDLYAITQLQTTVTPVIHLLNDKPLQASEELEDVIDRWSHKGTYLQHWQYMQSQSLIALYQSEPEQSLVFIDQQISKMQKTLLFRIQSIRVFTYFVRANAAIFAAILESKNQRKTELLQRAKQDIIRLQKEKIVPESVSFLQAQVFCLEGNYQKTYSLLQQAIEGFEAREMIHLSNIATLLFAKVTGGEKGKKLQNKVERWMKQQNISNPGAFVSMLAPTLYQ